MWVGEDVVRDGSYITHPKQCIVHANDTIGAIDVELSIADRIYLDMLSRSRELAGWFCEGIDVVHRASEVTPAIFENALNKDVPSMATESGCVDCQVIVLSSLNPDMTLDVSIRVGVSDDERSAPWEKLAFSSVGSDRLVTVCGEE